MPDFGILLGCWQAVCKNNDYYLFQSDRVGKTTADDYELMHKTVLRSEEWNTVFLLCQYSNTTAESRNNYVVLVKLK